MSYLCGVYDQSILCMKNSKWVQESPVATIFLLMLLVAVFYSIGNPGKVSDVFIYAIKAGKTEVYNDTLRINSFLGYFDDKIILTEFEKIHNTKVILETYTSNEELYDSLKSGRIYDIILPTDYMVMQLVNEGKLAEIERSMIDNYNMIDIRFSEMDYDYGNKYSIPYFWGAVGLMYDSQYIYNPPLSWSVVLDTIQIKRTRFSLALLDDPRMTLGISLISMGYNPNTMNEDEIRAATSKLIDLAPFIRDVNSNVNELFINGELNVALNWSGTASLIASKKSNIRFSMPSEGSIFFVDNLCIPINAPNPVRAHQLINFLLDPKIAARLTNTNYFPNPVMESRRYVDRLILKGPSYTNPFLSSNIHYLRDLGTADTLYLHYWNLFREAYDRSVHQKRIDQENNNRLLLF
jgi:spermidine/putrescine transport system substrate-binding protein